MQAGSRLTKRRCKRLSSGLCEETANLPEPLVALFHERLRSKLAQFIQGLPNRETEEVGRSVRG